ncbi:ABC transporter I family member 11, chloroplastic-like isoform X3 [Tripterygium wilfordii]|uniref:ABC transporter I family member 11, chloroplastic-like isoform X3 n=1 Tax=Tripterygium wilfordii TaxID=458696 RepID=UPI0018F84C3F|nr:ABC transporter I family member 11, chloroplastic-like isoform X3 [Tripterygium wilfordii]XP_038699125.1 ABC transporter I family member 11, chloroplastic-like isoform X3 [Tripterygium wilfordii]
MQSVFLSQRKGACFLLTSLSVLFVFFKKISLSILSGCPFNRHVEELTMDPSSHLSGCTRQSFLQARLYIFAINFHANFCSFGLIFGQSGSGKTTLLQLLAGLNKPTSGSIYFQKYSNDGNPNQTPEPLFPERVGIVFQFPERYFVADNVLDEVTFGWPRQKGGLQMREQLALKLQRAINWVGLTGIPLDKDPNSLSGGYKRRLALAIQLVQTPDLLILDEPLAGLADWKARADVVKLLKHLKREVTVLVVSHDLKELAALVDRSWRMEMGGVLREESPAI